MKKELRRICGISSLFAAGPLVVSGSLIAESSSDALVMGEVAVGGLVGGAIEASILNSHSTGEVMGLDFVGGMVGIIVDTVVSECHSSASVDAEEDVGGLIGLMHSGTVANSFATGSVVADWFGGGLVGAVDEGLIFHCYSSGAVSGFENGSGGLIAYADAVAVAVIASYWNTQTSGQNQSAAGEGRTTAEMTHPHAANTYVGWDFDTVWAVDAVGIVNNGYPYPREPVGHLWREAIEYGGGWRGLEWFGLFNDVGGSWIYHDEHGWWYCAANGTDSLWIHEAQLGVWAWTADWAYPWIYFADPVDAWTLYDRGGHPGGRWFFHTGAQQWRHEGDLVGTSDSD